MGNILAQSLATEFAFVRILALKVAPILAGRSGSRQAHRSFDLGPSWVTSPSTALLEDFPPSTCAGGNACPPRLKTPEPEWDDSTTTSIVNGPQNLHAGRARNRSNAFSRRPSLDEAFYAREIVWRSDRSLFKPRPARSVRGPCLGGDRMSSSSLQVKSGPQSRNTPIR